MCGLYANTERAGFRHAGAVADGIHGALGVHPGIIAAHAESDEEAIAEIQLATMRSEVMRDLDGAAKNAGRQLGGAA